MIFLIAGLYTNIAAREMGVGQEIRKRRGGEKEVRRKRGGVIDKRKEIG